jgi:protein-S-isoprenylcysteine O-methyltransferase Ste14
MNRRSWGLLEASGQIITLTILGVGVLDNRFSWSPSVNTSLRVLGGVLVACGFVLGGWAMSSNAHYSATLSQSQRGHRLASSGPYRFVRHPGYAGFILSWFGAPLLLGALWALVPSLIGSWLTVLRTASEDRILHDELSGYGQYAQSVRYRLLPGVW